MQARSVRHGAHASVRCKRSAREADLEYAPVNEVALRDRRVKIGDPRNERSPWPWRPEGGKSILTSGRAMPGTLIATATRTHRRELPVTQTIPSPWSSEFTIRVSSACDPRVGSQHRGPSPAQLDRTGPLRRADHVGAAPNDAAAHQVGLRRTAQDERRPHHSTAAWARSDCVARVHDTRIAGPMPLARARTTELDRTSEPRAVRGPKERRRCIATAGRTPAPAHQGRRTAGEQRDQELSLAIRHR